MLNLSDESVHFGRRDCSTSAAEGVQLERYIQQTLALKVLMTILFHDGYVQTIGISATESHRTTQIQYFVLAR